MFLVCWGKGHFPDVGFPRRCSFLATCTSYDSDCQGNGAFLIDVSPFHMCILLTHVPFIKQTRRIVAGGAGKAPSFSPGLGDKWLFILTVGVHSALQYQWFCSFQLLWDICHFLLVILFLFLLLECLVSHKYLHNMYLDQDLLCACGCITALLLNS